MAGFTAVTVLDVAFESATSGEAEGLKS